MSRRDARRDLIQHFLDGTQDLSKNAEIARLLRSDPSWKDEVDEMQRVVSLLEMRVDATPPSDLLSGALAAIEARRQSTARTSARVWKWSAAGLGLAGLGVGVAIVGTFPAPEPAQWVGGLAVETARALTLVKSAALSGANWLGLFDWVPRVAECLTAAMQAVLVASVRGLTPALPGAALLTVLTGWALWRAEHGRRERGMAHGTLHLFA
jgi:hypothetical protein